MLIYRAFRDLQTLVSASRLIDRMNWARRIFHGFGYFQEPAVKIVVGLGNPGKKYERTRHNLGFVAVDRIAAARGIDITAKKHQSLIGQWETGSGRILLVKPQTYMNRCGDAVAALLRYNPLSFQDLVVVYDDLDLPFGRIRIRVKGGAAGHRGLLSIMESLGREDFSRVRLGIGRPPVDPTNYVLQPFSPEEESQLEAFVSRAAESVETLLTEGPIIAMDKFNG